MPYNLLDTDGLDYLRLILCGARHPSTTPPYYNEHAHIINLTIIPRAWMGSESIDHEVKGRMGYSLRGLEGEKNNCFSKIQLVGQKYRDKTT